MSKKNKAQTLPALLRVVDKILTAHHNEKGVIHCNSYALGNDIYAHFSRTLHDARMLFPTCADDRDSAMAQHKMSPLPTVLVSPSMTEGFDFKDELARWQVVAKMPYPYLGDQQVAAMKERNPDWYALQTASTIIQACGRIVRTEEDHGVTYILDADFNHLWTRHSHFFPPWFKSAMQWPSKK
jgi:Rad3-related DNA helicase